MTQELRMLLKVSVHAVKKHNTNQWQASFTGLGVQIEGITPSDAICNYLKWVESRLASADPDSVIAADLGINEAWIPESRSVFASKKAPSRGSNLRG
jgi:hypothetical protein